MGEEEADARSIWIRRILWSLCIIGGLLVLHLLFLALFGRRVTAAVARLERAGYCTTLKALDASYAYPPSGENAADIYLATFKAQTHVGPEDEQYEQLPVVGGGELPPPCWKAA